MIVRQSITSRKSIFLFHMYIYTHNVITLQSFKIICLLEKIQYFSLMKFQPDFLCCLERSMENWIIHSHQYSYRVDWLVRVF